MICKYSLATTQQIFLRRQQQQQQRDPSITTQANESLRLTLKALTAHSETPQKKTVVITTTQPTNTARFKLLFKYTGIKCFWTSMCVLSFGGWHGLLTARFLLFHVVYMLPLTFYSPFQLIVVLCGGILTSFQLCLTFLISHTHSPLPPPKKERLCLVTGILVTISQPNTLRLVPANSRR